MFVRSLAGQDTDEKATTRRIILLLYLYIAGLGGLEEAGHLFATMGWRRQMGKVRANAETHARLFALRLRGRPNGP